MIKHTGKQSKKANDFEKLVRRFRGLGFSEGELAPELELLGYARKYITGFPE